MKFLTLKNKDIFESLYLGLNNISEWEISNIDTVIDSVMNKLNLKMPEFAKPIRLALTGNLSSPSINLTIFLLGKEACLKRILDAKRLIT